MATMYDGCWLLVEMETHVERPLFSCLWCFRKYFRAFFGLVMGRLKDKCRNFFLVRGCNESSQHVLLLICFD